MMNYFSAPCIHNLIVSYCCELPRLETLFRSGPWLWRSSLHVDVIEVVIVTTIVAMAHGLIARK